MENLGVEMRSRPPYERLPSNTSPSSRAFHPPEENTTPALKEIEEIQKPPDTSEHSQHTQQGQKLWLRFAVRWTISLAFALLIVATLKIYEQKGNFSSKHKTTFNAIITALILGLGLNIFVNAT